MEKFFSLLYLAFQWRTEQKLAATQVLRFDIFIRSDYVTQTEVSCFMGSAKKNSDDFSPLLFLSVVY